MKIHLVLWDVEYSLNIGLAIRDCYMLGDGVVDLTLFDPRGVAASNAEEVRRFSSYALDHFGSFNTITDQKKAKSWLEKQKGNIIATVPNEERAIDLRMYPFGNDCVILFGNEFQGLPPEILDLADSTVVIPMMGKVYARPDPTGKIVGNGQQRCLGLSACIPIVLFSALSKVGAYRV
jgi:tRNA G18 (ribose-2'-O)-methylase SpoU